MFDTRISASRYDVTAQRLGKLGEMFVLRTMKREGIPAKKLPRGADLYAAGTLIEVKTSRFATGMILQACVNKDGRTSTSKADVVVIVGVVANHAVVAYVIPAAELSGIQTLKISQSGKYAKYRVTLNKLASVLIGEGK